MRFKMSVNKFPYKFYFDLKSEDHQQFYKSAMDKYCATLKFCFLSHNKFLLEEFCELP